jgi:hypothetical protein
VDAVENAPKDLEIDASGTEWFGPLGTTMLALAIARRVAKGGAPPTFIPPVANDARRFLDEVGIDRYLDGRGAEREEGPSALANSRTVRGHGAGHPFSFGTFSPQCLCRIRSPSDEIGKSAVYHSSMVERSRKNFVSSSRRGVCRNQKIAVSTSSSVSVSRRSIFKRKAAEACSSKS